RSRAASRGDRRRSRELQERVKREAREGRQLTGKCKFCCCSQVCRLIIGVSGRDSAPSLVSVGGIVPHHWYQWEE
ncbi:unnamed protein product, partial [Staurois parvus]